MFFYFSTRLLPTDFQTRHANLLSISYTLICDHFPPNSALCSLKSCNADLKLSQSILLHMAPQPVKCRGSRWWERSIVFHNLCQKVFCTKIINFFLPAPSILDFAHVASHKFIFTLDLEMSEMSLHNWNMVIKQQFSQNEVVLFAQACGHF
jgi:hypothetical protein